MRLHANGCLLKCVSSSFKASPSPVRVRLGHLFDVPLVLVVHLLWLDEVLAGGLQLLLHLGDPGGQRGHALLHLGQLVVLLLQQVLQLHHLARLSGRLQRAVGQTLHKRDRKIHHCYEDHSWVYFTPIHHSPQKKSRLHLLWIYSNSWFDSFFFSKEKIIKQDSKHPLNAAAVQLKCRFVKKSCFFFFFLGTFPEIWYLFLERKCVEQHFKMTYFN